MANVAARMAGQDTIDRLGALVDRMDELVDDHVTYEEHDRAFHDTVMQASGNRIARGVVKSLESQVIHTARYVGRTERALCVASNLGHRRIYERIAAHDPDGAADDDVRAHHRRLAGPPRRAGRRPAAAPVALRIPGRVTGRRPDRLCRRQVPAAQTVIAQDATLVHCWFVAPRQSQICTFVPLAVPKALTSRHLFGPDAR